MEKFAAIDFETANWQQTSVCSVGIVVMNRGVIEDRFYSLIHPAPNFYSRRNTAIHGLSREDTEEALAFPTVWREIAPMIEGIPLVAHNSMYDEGCLKAVFGFTKWIIPVTPFTVPTAFPGNYLKDWKIISCIPFLPFADMT